MLQVVQNELDHCLFLDTKQLLDFVCNKGPHVLLKQVVLDQLSHVHGALQSRLLALRQFAVDSLNFFKFQALLLGVHHRLLDSGFFQRLLGRLALSSSSLLTLEEPLLLLLYFKLSSLAIILNLLLALNFLLHLDEFLDLEAFPLLFLLPRLLLLLESLLCQLALNLLLLLHFIGHVLDILLLLDLALLLFIV